MRLRRLLRRAVPALAAVLLLAASCGAPAPATRSISAAALKDKIAGGWAGKMIGVTYGAPTEFHALGRTYDDSLRWTPEDIRGSVWQDDIYVQLTFMMTMDRFGRNAPAAKFHEMFATAGYMLWHANAQARKNYYDGILPPASGAPENNPHADDIDFQIEADYIGFISPGMPAAAAAMADTIGHIMNYGDGVYGGVFLAALYTHAFFSDDIPSIIADALRSLPPESAYARIVRDVIALHRHHPSDWRAAWRELQAKWGHDHFCAAGGDFNIDATLNGAYIVMGLLYGGGDPMKTMEITTRCGQDSDCNPSSAMAVLGVVLGFDRLPPAMKQGVMKNADSLFINTDYSFRKAVERTYDYALETVRANGGTVEGDAVTVRTQEPVPVRMETSFPSVVLDTVRSVLASSDWTFSGDWGVLRREDWRTKKVVPVSRFASASGASAQFVFSGTGVSVEGHWVRDGGKADVYLDGAFRRTIDTYFFYNGQEHDNIPLWHVTGLDDTLHTLRIVVRGEGRPGSLGSAVHIARAAVFTTAPKRSSTYRFPFER